MGGNKLDYPLVICFFLYMPIIGILIETPSIVESKKDFFFLRCSPINLFLPTPLEVGHPLFIAASL